MTYLSNLLKYLLATLVVCAASSVQHTAYAAPTYESCSQLDMPVVYITTVDGEEPTCEYIDHPEGCMGYTITNASKVPSRMVITKKGETIYDSGEYVKKESGLTIKIRGNTSVYLEKKSYKLKLQKKADLLCRGDKKYKDKDWVLLNTGSDMKTMIGYWLSELALQEWTPSHQNVNVFLNGDYKGVYVLAESVSVNPDCRIDVDEDTGYVVEYDAYWWNEDIYFSSDILQWNMKYTYKYPDSDDVTEEKNMEVAQDIWAVEKTITDGTYPGAIDCLSFAKWLICWDILGGKDAAGSNMFVVRKNPQSLLQMGPIWDFDNSFQMSEEWTMIHTEYFYFNRLLKSSDRTFFDTYHDFWKSDGHRIVEGLIDRITSFVSSDEGKDYAKALAMEAGISSYSLTGMRNQFVNFLNHRMKWIDDNIAGEDPDNASVHDITNDHGSDGDAIYNISGRRINAGEKGIHIHNGKKQLKR